MEKFPVHHKTFQFFVRLEKHVRGRGFVDLAAFNPHETVLDHVAVTLSKYTGTLEISADDLTSLQADAVSFRYALNILSRAQSYAHNCTAFKNLLRDGGTDAIEWPVAPLLPEPIPPIVKSGIIPRFSLLINRLKAHKNYSPAIGQDLQIIGSAYIIDPSTWKPVLSSLLQAGHPTVVWAKGKTRARNW